MLPEAAGPGKRFAPGDDLHIFHALSDGNAKLARADNRRERKPGTLSADRFSEKVAILCEDDTAKGQGAVE